MLALPNLTSLLGAALLPQLLDSAPVLLLVLHPYAPLAVLALPSTGTLLFLVVTVLARVVPRTLAFFVGRAAGKDALEARLAKHPTSRGTRAVRFAERALPAALLFLASAPISAFAGASGMRTGRFLFFSFLGATASASVIAVFGAAATKPLESLTELLRENSLLWFASVAVLAVVFGLAVAIRRFRRTARAARR